MHQAHVQMLWINVLGGTAVLGSYAHGLLTNPGRGNDLWGGVPESLRPLYGLGMLAATVGYFCYTYYLFFRLDPEAVQVGGLFGFGVFNLIYLLILIPSALWMPLTFRMLESPGPVLWLVIRGVLALVGIGSAALVAALVLVEPKQPAWAHVLAVAGAVAFFLHTAVLDGLVWPAYFTVGDAP